MWGIFSNFVNQYLGPINITFGVLIAIPVFWTWYEVVFGKKRRFRQWAKNLRKQEGEIKAVLTVCLLPGRNIENEVKKHCVNTPPLNNIPDNHFAYISRNKDLRQADMAELALEVRQALATIAGRTCDDLYVFIAGPVIAGALIGAELKNLNCRVHLMQNDRAARRYVDFGIVNYPML